MNTRTWLGISLVANAVGAVILAFALTRHREAPAGSFPEAARKLIADAGRPAKRAKAKPVADGADIPRIWNRIEVADCKQYADNLRAMGIPEQLVRDIVLLDLTRSFGERVSELVREMRPPFWQAQSFNWKSNIGTAEVAQAVAEFRQTCIDALGIEPSRWYWDQMSWMAKAEPSDQAGLGNEFVYPVPLDALRGLVKYSYNLDWLPKNRADGMMALRASFAARQSALEASRTDANADAIEAQLQGLRQELETAETAYLTPEERHERELRSNTSLIEALAGVDLSREEFEKLAALANKDGAKDAWRTEGAPEQAEALKLLGRDRYDEVMRGHDKSYVSFLLACKQADMDQRVAVGLLDIKRQYDAAIAGKDPAQIEAIRLEALAAADTLVGSNNADRVGDLITQEFRIPEVSDPP
jgi:hypothetical protein